MDTSSTLPESTLPSSLSAPLSSSSTSATLSSTANTPSSSFSSSSYAYSSSVITHPCSICRTRVPLSSLVQHLDSCREERVYTLARALNLSDSIASLFRAGTHNLHAHVSAIMPPLTEHEEDTYQQQQQQPLDQGTKDDSSPSLPTIIQEQMSVPSSSTSSSSSSSSSSGSIPVAESSLSTNATDASPSTALAIIVRPPEYEVATDWYTKAKNQQYSTSPVVQGTPLDTVKDTSPSNHAIILLPNGPSYMCNDYDAGHVITLPLTIASPHSVRLYIGSEAAARSPRFLKENSIHGIINCAIDSEPLPEHIRTNIPVHSYTQLPIVDAPGKSNTDALSDGADQVYRTMKILEEKLSTTVPADTNPPPSSSPGVLVHCVAGVSRSTSVLIAYLMKYQQMSLLDAATAVKRVRKVAYPNIGFWRALREIEYRTYGTYSIPEEALQLHKSCPLTALRIK